MVSGGDLTNRQGWTLSDFFLAILAGYVGAFATALALVPLDDRALLAVGSLVGQYVGHLLGIGYVVRRRRSSFAGLGLDVRPSDGLYVLGGAGLQILIAYASAPLLEAIDEGELSQAVSRTISGVDGVALRAVLVLAITMLVPVTEELMFRGLLLKSLVRRMGGAWAVVVSAAIFAPFHLLGTTSEGDFLARAAVFTLQLFVVGLVLGWQARKRRRLGVAIFIHSGFNLVAVLALLVAPVLS